MSSIFSNIIAVENVPFIYGDNVLLGTENIPFFIPEYDSHTNNYYNSGYAPKHVFVNTSVDSPSEAYFLISGGGTYNQESRPDPLKFGEINLIFEDGSVFKTELIERWNLREWILDAAYSAHETQDPKVQEIWRGMSPAGNGPAVADMLTIPIAAPFNTKHLLQIEILDTSGPYRGFHVFGITVKAGGIPIEPPEPNPVVFIPGFGGSWSYKGIIENQPTTYSDWQLMPIFTDAYYQPLISTLANSGQTINIFAYDFRQSVSNSAANLNTFLDNQLPGKKVNVVAHSMGSLVVRYCIEEIAGCSDKIDRIITAGGPHQGTVKAYELWEGGKFDSDPAMKIIEEVILHTTSYPYLTNKDIVQNKFPGVRDLLPIFDYIEGKPYASLSPLAKNPLLESLLPVSSLLSANLTTFSSGSENTQSGFTPVKRNPVEVALGLWIDGKPKDFALASGDGTILQFSSQLPPAANNNYSLGHNDYLRSYQSLSDLLDIFDLPNNGIVTENKKVSSVLAFIIHSPAIISVSGQSGQAIFLTNPNSQQYQISLNGTDNGPFQLDAYYADENISLHRTMNGNITSGQSLNLPYDFTPDFRQRFAGDSLLTSLQLNVPEIAQTLDKKSSDEWEKSYFKILRMYANETSGEKRKTLLEVADQLLSLIIESGVSGKKPGDEEIVLSQKFIDARLGQETIPQLQAANLLTAQEYLENARLLENMNNYQSYLLAHGAKVLAQMDEEID